MIKVLVTGKDSQLAQCIQAVSINYSEIEFSFKNSVALDITNKQSISKHFTNFKFDYCINCAAYTAVDKAEHEQENVMAVNKTGVKNLAEACKSHNVILIHISTDFVFDGESNSAYQETDDTNPLGIYGISKREGEKEIIQSQCNHFIIRTSWLYSDYGKNFLKTMLKLSASKKQISVVNDQIGSPTNANDLAEAICKIITSESKNYGLFHFSNLGETSWYEFAKEIFKIWGVKMTVVPILTSQYPTLAKRPKYSVLNSSKMETSFNLEIINWQQSLLALYSTKN